MRTVKSLPHALPSEAAVPTGAAPAASFTSARPDPLPAGAHRTWLLGRHRLYFLAALLLLLAAVLLLAGLGSAPLFDLDEGAFAEATRELLARHQYLVTTLNGELRWDKPILIYWLQAASVSLFGLTPFAFRLPSALAGMATALLIQRFTDRQLPRPPSLPAWLSPGLLAGLMFVTSLGPFIISRAATADALLQLCLCGAGFAVWDGHQATGYLAWRRAGLRLFAWMGLGLLAKGPIALLVPGMAGVILYAGGGRFRDGLRLALWWPGWLLLLLIAGPWYGLVLWRYGMAFVDGFLLHHNLQRFAGPFQGHGGSLFYYLPVLLLLTLPYTGAVLAAFCSLPRVRYDALDRFLWGWFGFVFLFFSLSGTKLPHYLLYGIAPLFILTVRHVTQPAGQGRRIAMLTVPLLWLGLWLALPLLLVSGHIRLPEVAQLMLQDVTTELPLSWLLTVGMLMLIYLLAAWRWQRQPLLVLAGAGLGTALLMAFVVTPFAGWLQQGPVVSAARFAAARPEPLVQWNCRLPSIAVYLQREVPVRAPKAGEIALVRRDRLPPGAQLLFAERHIAIVRPAAGRP